MRAALSAAEPDQIEDIKKRVERMAKAAGIGMYNNHATDKIEVNRIKGPDEAVFDDEQLRVLDRDVARVAAALGGRGDDDYTQVAAWSARRNNHV